MPEEEKRILDREIAERVLGLPEITDAKAVYGYASLNWETGTGELLKELWKKNTSSVFRKSPGDDGVFCDGVRDDLTEGAFHIMEPKNGCRSAKYRK